MFKEWLKAAGIRAARTFAQTFAAAVVIGRFIGTAGISAVSSAGNIMMIFTNFSMGVSGAGQVIIAQFLGKGDRASVSRTVGIRSLRIRSENTLPAPTEGS